MIRLPKVGMRMIKTTIAVIICLLISYLRGSEAPVLSAVAALICMQPQVEDSVAVAMNRIIGTLLGVVFALLAILLIERMGVGELHLVYIIVAVGIIPVLYVTVLLKQNAAAALAGVIFLSVALGSSGESPMVEGMHRAIETIIGVLVSVVVNSLHVPRRREKDIFFVSGFDGVLFDGESGVTSYSMFELNQLLHDGAAFTIATERTPASLVEDISQLDLQLPVIAMGGAVLYDVKEKRYLACIGIPEEMAERIVRKLDEMDIHYFLNVVWQDVLLIYHQELKNEEEQKLYDEARRSPHRNYVHGERPDEGDIAYVLMVIEDEIADAAQEALAQLDTYRELRFLRDKSESAEGYCHLKVYHRDATKEFMMRRLLEGMKQKKIIAFGSNENDVSMLAAADLSFAVAEASYEVRVMANRRLRGRSGDSIVRKIRRLYSPLYWEKLPKELRDERGKG